MILSDALILPVRQLQTQ